MVKRIFRTGVLPESLIAKYKLSFAACNFSFNLMSGGMFDKVYSILPLYVGGEMEKCAFEDERFELVYDDLRARDGLWKKLAALKEQFTVFKKVPKGSVVWFYNLNTLNAFLFLLLNLFKPRVQLNVIVLDFTPVDAGVGLNSFYLKLINRAHGRICLANSPLFNQKNSVVLPGVIPREQVNYPTVDHPKMSFLLSGVLSETISQLSMVLETFSKLPHCELHITGKVEDDTKICDYVNRYSNIHYYGVLSFDKYVELLHSVTFQLSTRDPRRSENQCNFPSKILESLYHNRAIVSTIHYEQLNGINIIECLDKKSNSLFNCIKRLEKMEVQELMKYVNQGPVVKELFSTDVWSKTMNAIEKNEVSK